MSALLESLATQHAALQPGGAAAASLAAARATALADLQASGVPSHRHEAWKYTSLRALTRHAFTQPPPTALDASLRAAVDAIPAPRLVLVDGRYAAELSSLQALPEGVDLQSLATLLAADDTRAVNFLARRFASDGDLFARANGALAEDGVVLRVAADVVVAAPVHLVFVGGIAAGACASHQRGLVELRERARLCVVEHWIAPPQHQHLCTSVMHVHLKPDAELTHLRLQRDGAGGSLFARTDAVMAGRTRYRRLDLEVGDGLSRHELNIALQGEHAHVRADGVLLARASAHVDTRLGIDHAARDTASSLTWRGLARDRGRVAFHGGIMIREGADGTDAMLSNKNLLLSGTAEIDTQPVLEIHADEVKAAHGATVGRLDATALFYLRSRGLSQDEAQALLTVAFCHELLQGFEPVALSELLAAAVDGALQRDAAA